MQPTLDNVQESVTQTPPGVAAIAGTGEVEKTAVETRSETVNATGAGVDAVGPVPKTIVVEVGATIQTAGGKVDTVNKEDNVRL